MPYRYSSKAALSWLLSVHDHMCAYCGGAGDKTVGPDGERWHKDHVIPISRGGSDAMNNLALACATCNVSKGGKLPEEFDVDEERDELMLLLTLGCN